jgi:hypothetical protein
MKLNAMLFAMGVSIALGACATSSEDRPPTIVGGGEEGRIDTGGIPPYKQADIILVLQQRDASARKCYQDELNVKHTREFKGRVTILLSLNTDGTARAARVMKSTLNSKEVENCLIETVKQFEYPKLDRAGDFQYDYTFEPQY